MFKKQSHYKCKTCKPKDKDNSSDICMICETSDTGSKLKIVKKQGRQSINYYKHKK